MKEEILTITDEKYDKYSRLRLISWWEQERLMGSSVMVVGVGALGNEVAKNLAQLGVGNIFLIDFDFIEPSNLTRSVLFREDEDGQKKVEVAARRLVEINRDVNVQPFHGDIIWDLGLGVFRRMDVVIGCLDNREARLAVNRSCWKVGVPWINGGIQELNGVVEVFIPPGTACYECTLTELDYKLLNLRYSCPLLRREDLISGKVPTVSTVSSIIGGLQVQEAVKILHGMKDSGGKCFAFTGPTNDFYTSELRRKEFCMSHEAYNDIVEIDRGAEELTARELIEIDLEMGEYQEHGVIELDREIVTKLICKGCGEEYEVIKALGKVTMSEGTCPNCASLMDASLTHLIKIDDEIAGMKLFEIGIPLFHIIRVKNDGNYKHYELTKDRNKILKKFKEVR
jgi:adenylyltransferase/sulfurtransferase